MKLLRNIIIVSSAAIAEARSETRTRRNLKKDSYGGKSGKSRSSTTSSKSGKDGIVGFESDLGDYGTFKMDVYPDGTVMYDVQLTNLDWVTAKELTWHLHSGNIGRGASDASEGPAVACGANYTSGHYDPWLKCGAASTGPSCNDTDAGVPCCYKKPATDYCINQNIGTCEVGDLSGLYGKLNITNNSGQIKATGLCPDCIKDYHPKASAVDMTALYNTWASIVFHGTNTSAAERILCADIKMA